MSEIIHHSEFKPTEENINFGEPKTTAVGSQSVFVGMNGSPIMLQFPSKMYVPFGTNRANFGVKGSTDGKPAIEISFKGINSRPELKEFFDNIRALESVVKSAAKKNSLTWLKKPTKKVSDDMIDDYYCSMIKVSRDPETNEPNNKYPDTMKLKFKMDNDGNVLTKFFSNKTKKEIDSSQHTEQFGMKGSCVKVIAKCGGIWIGKKTGFGMTWVIEQIVPYPYKGLGNTYAFKDESDEIVESEEEDDDLTASDEDEEE